MRKTMSTALVSLLLAAIAGTLFSLVTLAADNENWFLVAALGALVFGSVTAIIVSKSSFFSTAPLSLGRARTHPSGASDSLDFERAVIGVGTPNAPFSFASFWRREDGTIVAMYLRPRWPYLPLRIDEGWETMEDALSGGLGPEVRLLKQGEFTDALREKRFAFKPDAPAL